MSGSGGGGGYVPPQAAKFDCKMSQIKTTVSSIDLDVLKKHEVGDILNIAISTVGTLIIEDGDGEVLGSILHSNTEDIIACIKAGNEYDAEIIDKTTLTCRVLIKRK